MKRSMLKGVLGLLVVWVGLAPAGSARAQVGAERLTQRIEAIRRDMGALRIGVAYRDHQTGAVYNLRENTMFSAASMIKVAIMVAVYDGVHRGRFTLDTPVRVANHFPVTGAGSVRGTELDRDVHAALGGTLTMGQLTEAMVARSSNLATNVLLERIGIAETRRACSAAGLHGLQISSGMGAGRRSGGNDVSASGLADLLDRLHAGTVISAEASQSMMALLYKQMFDNGIPAGLPADVRHKVKMAHKTGNIPTAEHDAALIYVPGRAPYRLVILTDWPRRGTDHPQCLVRVTQAVYEELMKAPAR